MQLWMEFVLMASSKPRNPQTFSTPSCRLLPAKISLIAQSFLAYVPMFCHFAGPTPSDPAHSGNHYILSVLLIRNLTSTLVSCPFKVNVPLTLRQMDDRKNPIVKQSTELGDTSSSSSCPLSRDPTYWHMERSCVE